MKKIKIGSMMMLVLMVFPMMVACGDDNDDGGGASEYTEAEIVELLTGKWEVYGEYQATNYDTKESFTDNYKGTIEFKADKSVRFKVTDGTKYKTSYTITIDGQTFGTISDVNGVYRLESDKIFDYLTFEYAGYKPYMVKIKRFTTQTINVKMESVSITLPKAEIKAQRKIKEKYRRKNNSAVDLIRKVQKNAERNSLSGFDYYQYDEYSKLELGPSNLSNNLEEADATC